MMGWLAGGCLVGGIGVGQAIAGRGASVNGGGHGQQDMIAGAAPIIGKQGRQAARGCSVGKQVRGGTVVPGASPDRGADGAGCCVFAGADDSC